jgi:ribosomal protein S18 acetylase RimI-like enzyme
VIRPYDSDDADALWRLKRAFETAMGDTDDETKAAAYDAKLTGDYRTDWLAWVRRCTDDEECLFVAERDGDLVGYLFLLPERLVFVWDAAVLNEVYVVPEYRGTGVADDLMERGLACAREQSLPLDRLVLDVDGENERAKGFYDRYGFTRWGEMVARNL